MPQFEEDVFSTSIDCPFCSRLLGMRLKTAWNSTIDLGIMNIGLECDTCHRRIWERRAVPEVKSEQNTSSA